MHSTPLPSPAGRSRLRRAAAALTTALGAGLLAACGSLPANTGRTASHALADYRATPLEQRIEQIAPKPATRRNDTGLRLLGTVEAAYGSRIAMIRAAHKTLDLQYYSVHYDASTELLLEELRAAAARGVRVRLLIDDFNTGGRNAEVLRLDEVPGVEVRVFNPLTGPRRSQAGRLVGALFDFDRAQRRMHHKMFIADNALAVTGGRNLGDEYFGQGQSSNFLDLDLLVAGRLVRELSGVFDRFWNDERSYPAATVWPPAERRRPQPPAPVTATPDTPRPASAADSTPAAAAGATAAPAPHSVPGADSEAQQILDGRLALVWAPAQLLSDHPTKLDAEDPADLEGTVVDDLLHLLGRARRDLLIVSPYFVPGEKIMPVLRELRARGVRVRVLTNSLASNDAPLAHVGYARYRQQLVELGVELHELRPRGATHRRVIGSTPQSRSSLHSKALVMDGHLIVVGSMNLDMRSALQNTELGIVAESTVLAREMTHNIEDTLRDTFVVEEGPDGRVRWRSPPSADAPGGELYSDEPEASPTLKLLLRVFGPLAPDEVL